MGRARGLRLAWRLVVLCLGAGTFVLALAGTVALYWVRSAPAPTPADWAQTQAALSGGPAGALLAAAPWVILGDALALALLAGAYAARQGERLLTRRADAKA